MNDTTCPAIRFLIALVFLGLLAFSGCGDASVPAPTGQFLFQPEYVFASGEPSARGTGFFAKAPNDKIVAVSSAIVFEDEEDPALKEVRWHELQSEKVVFSSTQSWGPAGNVKKIGNGASDFDFSNDFILLPVNKYIEAQFVLEFDPRGMPEVGERVWFPNKHDIAPVDYSLISGTITECTAQKITIKLDKLVPLQSQAGAPVISKKTGQVVGMMDACMGRMPDTIFAAPIMKAVQTLNSSATPSLRSAYPGTKPKP